MSSTSAPGTTSANCPAVGEAKRGWACFYEGQAANALLCCIYDDNYGSHRVSRYGFRIYWSTNGSAPYADGAWAVTAP